MAYKPKSPANAEAGLTTSPAEQHAAQRAAQRILCAATSTPEPERLLTVPEVLGKLRVSRKTLYDHIRQKKIPAIKLGRRVLFCWPDVLDSLKRQSA